ncbi:MULTISPECIES: CCA tRNA nucleotidyltransferase [Exiguobacterium]|uniref:CCA tRNA nucleotidyltransferase n=1 Tax=Exiguobacterium TaxID=33986 RepID=UPI000877A5A7|nr:MULTISPECIES: CCA tRNA nucleotidyltransferase [Exiguobacterium]TCI37262.1 CCA tRNA nucleotidyltransferase [Exiguobacterium sp. SH4S7]TCI65368.1 CCA tRNA nucleotidyltransferase [Exiguobacterium sp. SH0S2]TCI80212.1 CCA tRNA nucleotidyltransferase [Exiguobacterium sp. SH0S1]
MTEWEYAKQIIKKINDHGGEAYIVGGAVRDYVRGTLPDDIDIATSLFPEDVMKLFPKSVPTGIDHGTVTVILDHHPFEVTTFRSEGTYSDSRRPDHVSLGVTLEEDMLRRDFTMNAMAFHDGNVVDLFGGRLDLEARIIRTVGSPYERFGEDALRIMRAFRFMSQLDFTLADDVRNAARTLGHKLQDIAMERIAIEFEKLMTGPAYRRALTDLVELGIHQYLPDVSKQLVHRVIADRRAPINAVGGWALFVYHAGDIRWLSPWKRSNALKREAGVLANLFDSGLDTFTVYETSQATLETYLRMTGSTESSDALKRVLPIQSRRELRFDGRDALQVGASGARIKHLLADLERRVVLGELANEEQTLREEAVMWLQREERS